MVKMFHVGVTVESAVPTVVVQVNPRTEADWDGMVREIVSHLPKIDQYHDGNTDTDMEIGVEFMTGKIVKPIVYPEDEELADAFGNLSEDLTEGLAANEDFEVIGDWLVELAGREGQLLERAGEVEKRSW